jgi:integrase
MFSFSRGDVMAKSRRRAKGEGSIYQRKDGRYVAEITLEDGKRKQFYGKTQKEALEKRRKAQREQEQGTLATGPQQTVKQFLEYWLENVYKMRVRLVTYEARRTVVNKHLLPILGRIRLQKLTAQHVQALYVKKLKEGLSPVTVRTINVVLHTALNYAKRIKLVGSNVCDDVELPGQKQYEVQVVLTPEQAQVLLLKVRGHYLEALTTLALTTGLRRGEILGLRWQDIDLEKGSLQVRRTLVYMAHHGFKEGEPKTEASKRKIVLPQFVIEVLKKHRTMQLEARLKMGTAWIDRDLVFPNKHGNFLTPASLASQFTRLLKDAGLPHMRFHDLRHNTATLLLSMGVSMKVIQELLGHSSFSTTANIYSHVLPAMQQEAMDKMDALFREQL